MMKPFQANLINAFALILLGLWEHFDNRMSSQADLLPVGFGVIFLIATPPFRGENRIVANIIAFLTFLLIIALIIYLMEDLEAPEILPALRTAVMLLTSAVFLVIFIKYRYVSSA